jgi:hypothetical protein
MNDKRRLLIGGVYSVPGNLRFAGQKMEEVCNDFEPHLVKNGFLASAPFTTISLIFRLGDVDNFDPEIGRIDRKHSELPVAISIDVRRLKKMAPSELKIEFARLTLEVLCDIAANYDLPYQFLDVLRDDPEMFK